MEIECQHWHMNVNHPHITFSRMKHKQAHIHTVLEMGPESQSWNYTLDYGIAYPQYAPKMSSPSQTKPKSREIPQSKQTGRRESLPKTPNTMPLQPFCQMLLQMLDHHHGFNQAFHALSRRMELTLILTQRHTNTQFFMGIFSLMIGKVIRILLEF